MTDDEKITELVRKAREKLSQMRRVLGYVDDREVIAVAGATRLADDLEVLLLKMEAPSVEEVSDPTQAGAFVILAEAKEETVVIDDPDAGLEMTVTFHEPSGKRRQVIRTVKPLK